MNEEGEGEVVKLETKAKPVDQRGLRVVSYQHGACNHRSATFIVDDALEEVQCGDCGAKLNAHWVLRQLARRKAGGGSAPMMPARCCPKSKAGRARAASIATR